MNLEELSHHVSDEYYLSRSKNDGCISLFDANSRDSGFEDPISELLGDDEFLEEFSEINFPKRTKLPTDFTNLIHKPIAAINLSQNPSLRRALTLEKDEAAPLRKKTCKRCDSHDEENFNKITQKCADTRDNNAVVPSNFEKDFLPSEKDIKDAVQRSCLEPDLIADFSRNHSLPLTKSRHQDLKAIDSHTLVKLLNGEFSDKIHSFRIIDCRYPYEYDGGHISGAENIYTHDQCSSLLQEPSVQSSDKTVNILIFHCEFSAERGPNLYRHLRKEDRQRNASFYPNLCYPEIYILNGGYKEFFEENFTLCSPMAYTRMMDPKHRKDMKLCRQRSKTCDSDAHSFSKRGLKSRSNKRFTV